MPDRRRLLNAGMAAVPVIVTLRPGAAWAASLTGCQAEFGALDFNDPDAVATISQSCQLSLGLADQDPWQPL